MTEKSFIKPYIDEDGVRRGWYVYLHRDNATNQVFYVGMGTHRRAWEEKRRNNLWKAKVAGLTRGFSVEVLKNDLSQIEAENLEKETVEQYGGIEEGSPLTNKIPGGRLEVAVSLESLVGLPCEATIREIETALSLDGVEYSSYVKEFLEWLTIFDEEQFQKTMSTLSELVEEHGPEILEEVCGGLEVEQYEFISGSRKDQLRLLAELDQKNKQLLERVLPIADELADSEIYTVEVLGCGIVCEMNGVDMAILYCEKRRISWEAFCGKFSGYFQSIRYMINEMYEELNELDITLEHDLSSIDETLNVYTDFLGKITV